MNYLRRLKAFARREWPTLSIIAIGIVLQLALISQSLNFLIQNLLPDDAFFYFQVAHNIVGGFGSSFDTINPTNGYHPLWMMICVAVYHFFPAITPSDATPIHVLLLLSVLMNAITACLIARILTRFSPSPWIRAFGMVIWMLNPYLLYETVNGLETSVALMLFAFFFLVVLRIEEGRPIVPYRGGYLFAGFVGGLMVLGRLDMGIMYFGAFGLWLLFRNGLSAGWKNALMAIIGGFPVGLWFIWNFINFHMFLTSASETEVLVNHVLTLQDNGSSLAQIVKASLYTTQFELNAFFARTGALSILCGFMGAAVVLIIQGSIRLPRRVRDISAPLALFGGFLLLFFANASIRWVGRTWYYVSIEAFLAILVVIVCDRLFLQIRYKKTVAVCLLGLTIFSFYVDWSKNLAPSKNGLLGQTELRDTAVWLRANLPPGTLVGTFAPGIMGYFYGGHLIDLDGWINNTAEEAIQKHQLWQYILDQKIAYIATYAPILNYRYKSFLGISNPFDYLTEVGTVGATQIYKVQ